MKHPLIVKTNGNLRHNQMIQEAATYRRMKRVASQYPRRNLLDEIKKRIPILKGQRMDRSADSPA